MGDFIDPEVEVGPAIMPSATCLISLLHLSHKLRFTGGLSVSGVVRGLPPNDGLLSNGKTIADVDAFLIGISF